MEARIEGSKLHLIIDMENPPEVSKSGKSVVIASTHGNVKTGAEYNGKPITIGFNAYVKN